MKMNTEQILSQTLETPCYYYNTKLLHTTLAALNAARANQRDIHVHYAVKANARPELLRIIAEAGLGADCVSGGEIKAAIEAGFPAESVV